MDEFITLGQIVKAQGIKGEVKIKPFTDDVSRFLKLRTVFLDAVPFKIDSLRVTNFVFVKFSGVNDRNEAEKLVGRFLKIDRVHATELDDGTYFLADLIGCDFFIDGQNSGKLTNIFQNGSADVFEIKLTSGKILLFPHLKRLNLVVDTKNSKISCESSLLNEVAVYNEN